MQHRIMTKAEFTQLRHTLRASGGLTPTAYRGHPIMAELRDLNWSTDRLEWRADLARRKGARVALEMTPHTIYR